MAKKPRIRAILSDWGKVVVDFDNFRTAAALSPLTRTDAGHIAFMPWEIRPVMFGELRELFDAYMRGHLTTACYRATMKRVLRLGCDDAVFDAAFADVFTPNEPIIALWKRFRAMGVKMVAASNVEQLRHGQLVAMGIHDLFDAHCLSYQVGVGKPDPAFFHKALKMAYISPEEALFIDDHEEFVQVARSQLMTGFTYDLKDHAAFERFLEGYEIAPYRLA